MPTANTFFDKVAQRYDAKNQQTIGGPNFTARIERLAEWFGDEADVLDVGCATGHITLALAEHVNHVHGIDVSGECIRLAQGHAEKQAIANATFSAIDASDQSLNGQVFDGITAFAVLHLVDDPRAMLQRLHALLKPGGYLVSETPCLAGNPLFRVVIPAMRLVGKAPYVAFLKLDTVKTMLEETGFEIIETKIYNPKSKQHSILAKKV